MVGHATDESKTAFMTRDPVRTSGVIELIRGLDDGRVAFLEIGQQYGCWYHPGFVPFIP